MEYDELIRAAREELAPYGLCAVCTVCDGHACKARIPGPGVKGSGDNAILNYEAWRRLRLRIDCVCESVAPDCSLSLFGHDFALPLFAGPIAAPVLHYGSSKYDSIGYNEALVSGCRAAGTAAFTGDGLGMELFSAGCEAVKGAEGCGVPTVKPWTREAALEKIEMAKLSGAFAIAMDIDAAGLTLLKSGDVSVESKTAAQLGEFARAAEKPFIVKGIMTPRAALRCAEAGAAAIVVSNHGGRVLDQCAPTADILPEIASAVRGSGMKLLVDGGLRGGADLFKAIALGADAALMARPFAVAVYGGGAEGVKTLVKKLKGELEDAMRLCSARTLADISHDMLSVLP
ncbi:MAG: alpha-hydroxy-acid oxidizing protein [Oscillospiraceae bacterium]|nr:alpha-hydroxy-acid oxidizing protein [Oscillospiraceae bacterium]